MNNICKVSIKGLWGIKNISFELNNDVNFFIGPNGTGKTTIINLIAYTLKADITSLFRNPFTNITLYLSRNDDLSYIAVDKNEDSLVYNIHFPNQEDARFEFNQRELYERYRRMEIRDNFYNNHYKNLQKTLEDILQLSWISVNRTSLLTEHNRDNPSIDKVINQLQNQLKGYFSFITNKCNDETDKFQKFVFKSLIEIGSYEADIINSMLRNSGVEKKNLKDIFNLFSVLDKGLIKQVDAFYDDAQKAAEKILNIEDVDLRDFSYVVNAIRLQSIIKEWNTVSNTQNEITSKKNTFLEIIESMFQHKKLIVNESNELMIKTKEDKNFPLEFLSSGEKQLLIILGNALLHNSTQNLIYVADEPELSLHIEWQEKLVLSLKKLTPNAQIIFATHSPDIVGPYQNNTINFDKIIYG